MFDEFLAQRHLDHLGRYRWYEYRDVATSNVIDHAPQSSSKSLLFFMSLTLFMSSNLTLMYKKLS